MFTCVYTLDIIPVDKLICCPNSALVVAVCGAGLGREPWFSGNCLKGGFQLSGMLWNCPAHRQQAPRPLTAPHPQAAGSKTTHRAPPTGSRLQGHSPTHRALPLPVYNASTFHHFCQNVVLCEFPSFHRKVSLSAPSFAGVSNTFSGICHCCPEDVKNGGVVCEIRSLPSAIK